MVAFLRKHVKLLLLGFAAFFLTLFFTLFLLGSPRYVYSELPSDVKIVSYNAVIGDSSFNIKPEVISQNPAYVISIEPPGKFPYGVVKIMAKNSFIIFNIKNSDSVIHEVKIWQNLNYLENPDQYSFLTSMVLRPGEEKQIHIPYYEYEKIQRPVFSLFLACSNCTGENVSAEFVFGHEDKLKLQTSS